MHPFNRPLPKRSCGCAYTTIVSALIIACGFTARVANATIVNAATTPPQGYDTFTNGMTAPDWTTINVAPFTLSSGFISYLSPALSSYYGYAYFDSNTLTLGYNDAATLTSSAGLFNLNTVSFADSFSTGVVDVTATFGNGSEQTIALNVNSSSLTSFAPGWTGLSSLSFTRSTSAPSNIVFDNLTVTSVPSPAAAWLMVSGLVSLGAWARKKPVRSVSMTSRQNGQTI